MFYIIFSVLFAIFVATFCVLKFVVFKNSEKFEQTSQKVLKIACIVYCSLMLVSILLPDRFALCFSSEELATSDINKGYAVVRWFSLIILRYFFVCLFRLHQFSFMQILWQISRQLLVADSILYLFFPKASKIF